LRAQDLADFLWSNRAMTQEFWGSECAVHDGGLHSNIACATIEYQPDVVTEILDHMLGSRGGHMTEAVCRRGSDGAPEISNHRLGEWMRGQSHGDGVTPTGDRSADSW
jgi:hypothetical protein